MRKNLIQDELTILFANSIFKFRKIKPSNRIRKLVEGDFSKVHFAPFVDNGGGIFLRRDKKKNLVAAVLITTVPVEYQPKLSQRKFMILSMPGDAASLEWAKSVLEDNESLLGKRCFGKIEYWQKQLIPWFESKGIGIRAVWLQGEVNKSLKRLRAHYGKNLREPFVNAGLYIAPARTVSEIDAYIRIIKSEFTKNPQFGAWVNEPKFLKLVRIDFKNSLKKSKPPLLIYKNKEICGGLDILEVSRGLDGKKRAVFGINLSSKIQGMGLSPSLYETILIELQDRGVETYYGNTGQPGVMRMGKVMGRWVSGYDLDRGVAKAFPEGHFKMWL